MQQRILFLLLALPLWCSGQITLSNSSFSNGSGTGTDGTFTVVTLLGSSGTLPIQNAIEPTMSSSTLVFNPVYSTQMAITFISGNGASHLVIIRADAAVTFSPADGIGYAVGQDLGNDQKVVSLDNSTTIALTGLTPNKQYFVSIFDYNGSGGNQNYKVSGLTGSRTTLALPLVNVTTPANGAEGVLVTTTVTANVLSGATTYYIQLSPVADFSYGILEKSGARSQSYSGLSFNSIYYSRVRTNLSPDFGPVKQFTTTTPESYSYVTSPASNSTGVLLTNLALSVTANLVPGAMLYTIELNSSPDFTGVSQQKMGGRTLSFTGLAPATTYYSRVRTELSTDWGQTRQFATANSAQLSYVVTPANNAINVSYQPTISANDVGAASYTIQVSPVTDFTAGVIETTGPTRTLNFIGLEYNTKYFSRVSTDQDPNWGPPRSFTTNSPLTYSYMTSPANNAVNVNYVTNITANVVPGATTYTIEANTQSDFLGLSIVQTGGRTMSFTLEPNQLYYVRVQTNLVPNQWGAIRSFATNSPLTYSYITSPANGASNVNYVTNITANAVPLATTYTIEANTQSDFQGISIVRTGGRTLSFTLDFNQLYYVRVQTNLLPNQWGATRSFITNSPLVYSYITSPSNNALNVKYATNITANAVPLATTYTIEANTQPDFQGISIVRTGGRTLSFTLGFDQLYYVRVQTDLAPNQWGATRSFTTNNPLVYSFVTTPADGATNVNSVTNITTNLVPTATSYIIEVNPDSNFGSGTAIVKMGTGRTYGFSLAYFTTYYARVKTNLVSGWGAATSFTTGDPVSLAYITSPANGTTGIPVAVNVTANNLVGATSYMIELNLASDFTGASIIKSGARTQSFNLAEGQTYFARVYTNLAVGMWGPTRSFSTLNPVARDRTDGEEVVEEEVVMEHFDVRVLGNPFRETLTFIIGTSDQREAVVTLSDMNGKTIVESLEKTNSIVEIHKSISQGIYLLKVDIGSEMKVQRVVKID